MSTTKKTVLFIIILLLLFWPKDGGGIFTPKVNPNDFIFEPDSLAVASLYSMLETASQPPIKPDDVADKCNCNKGKVSYDGGTSLTDCPCKLNGKGCNCIGCPYKGKGSANTEISPTSIIKDKDYFPRTVVVTQIKSCVHCRILDEKVLSKLRDDAHKKAGWNVGTTAKHNVQILDIDDESSRAEIERLKLDVDSLPTLYFLQKDGSYKFHTGSMTYKEYIDWAKVDSKKK